MLDEQRAEEIVLVLKRKRGKIIHFHLAICLKIRVGVAECQKLQLFIYNFQDFVT